MSNLPKEPITEVPTRQWMDVYTAYANNHNAIKLLKKFFDNAKSRNESTITIAEVEMVLCIADMDKEIDLIQ